VSATYAACLTPPGTGAIAVIAVRGPQALSAVQELFHPIKPAAQTLLARCASKGGSEPLLALRAPEEGSFRLGRFGEDLADEVVLSIQRIAPTPWLELHCHGGAEMVRLCLEALECRGIQICPWQQLERLTTDNPIRAAAAAALAEARTVRTAAILLDQYHGALERALDEIDTARNRGDTETADRLLNALAARIPVGRHLTEPWRVVIAGAPNVGKSSLVNALAGYQRSIVAATPGTTRDVVSTCIAVDGWPIELCDTAGLRADADALEALGIQQARTAVEAADLCLWVLDGSAAPVWPSAALANVRCVINKVDRPAAWDWSQAPEAVQVSAHTGHGIGALCAALAHWLVPEAPAAGSAVPFTAELCEQVEQASARS